MKVYEAIKNLTAEQMEKFLDQVFLTGMNTGHHMLVDPEIYDENPFDEAWLNSEAESPALVVNEDGESLVIEPLANVVLRIIEFDAESIPDDISWESKIIMPKGMNDEDEDNEGGEE